MKTKIPSLAEFRKQRATTASEGRPAAKTEVSNATTEPRCCWRCGAGAQPPSLDDQVALLRSVHERNPEIFWWGDAEWRRLRDLLRPGDLILVAGNYTAMSNPMYSAAAVRRGGETVLISRRELADA
jgi:hypothetical protein